MSAATDRWAAAQVVAQRLPSGERKVLMEAASDGWFLPTGHLAYVVGGTVHAVRFDVDRLEISGGAAPVLEGVRRSPLASSGITWFSTSHSGAVVHVPGPAAMTSNQLDIALVDRKGTISPLKLPPAAYDHPRMSPDGRKIAVGLDDGREVAVLIYDLARGGAMQRATFGGKNRLPVWTPDSRRLAFQSDRDGDQGIFWQQADGSSGPERLTAAAAGESHIPECWHPRGDVLFYSVQKGSEYALWTYSVRERTSTPFGGVKASVPSDAVVSPDGKWVAYTSGDVGTSTIYVQPFPVTGAMYQLVRQAGELPHHAVWSSNGKELIVNSTPSHLEAVSVTTSPTFAFGTRQNLPKGFSTGPPAVRRMYDIAPDGRLVGLIVPGNTQGGLVPQLNVVLNWFEEVKARVRAAR